MRANIWICLATSICLVVLHGERSFAANEQQAADEATIRGGAAAFTKAYNARDAKAVAALFAVDADSVDEEGTPVRGRDAIEADYTELFSDGVERTIDIKTESLRFITPDVAIEDGTFAVTPEPPGPPCDRKYAAVHVKRDGQWLISSLRDTRFAKQSHYEHLKELDWMIGDWIDESNESLVTTSCRWSDNKNFILRKYSVKVAGVNSSEGVQRIGWDGANHRVRSWLFDSQGGYGEGYWTKDGDRWVIEGGGVLPDGTKASATNILTKIDDDKFTWTSQDRVIGGQSVPDIEVLTIVRKPPAPDKNN